MGSISSQLRERDLLDQTTEGLVEREGNLNKRAYLGFDPTSDSLHLGNFQGIVALRWLQRLGWTPIVLIGGGTGIIGDPSGKSVERPSLTSDQLAHNAEAITAQLRQLLATDGNLPEPIFVDNSLWLGQFSLIEFLRDVGKHFRLGAMISKQSVRQRLNSPEGISFTEFSYQILQAYDFYRLHCDYGVSLQIGGSDQWGNITAGCEFVRRMSGKEVHGLTWPLLLKSDGQKFGKSESGALWLSSAKLSPFHLYQSLLQTPDRDIPLLLKRLTFLPISEIEALSDLPSGQSRAIQRHFASEIVRMIHGENGLQSALKATEYLHGDIPTSNSQTKFDGKSADLPIAELDANRVSGMKIFDLLIACKLTASRGQGRRLIQSGGVSINGARVDHPEAVIPEGDAQPNRRIHLGVGKKKRAMVLLI